MSAIDEIVSQALKYFDAMCSQHDAQPRDVLVERAIRKAAEDTLAIAENTAKVNQSDCDGEGCNLRWWNKRLLDALAALGGD